jgi:hypothetical protein
VRLRFIGKDASSKENYCDIFATINRGSTGTLYSEAIVPI